MEINKIEKALNLYPINVVGDPLLICLLKDAEIVKDPESLEKQLDSLSIIESKRYLLYCEQKYSDRFPIMKLEQKLNIRTINEAIYDNYSIFKKVLISQSDIQNIILGRFYKFDTIILIIVDGLSYFDIFKFVKCKPCFVDGVTKTYEGYRSVVGDPTIGRCLYTKGFSNLMGFSYWDRNIDPDLTNELFTPFGEFEPKRVKSFSEILATLKKQSLRKTYVQIITHGLDQLCHKNYEEPLIDAYINRLLENFASLKELMQNKKLPSLICLTSDHGILWKHKVDFEVVKEPAQPPQHSPRYIDGKIIREYTSFFNSWGKNYSLLIYPYLTRPLKHNEWGVHGGLSANESIVPLIIEEIL